MKLIVGLGNPEKKYDNTRHNIGFMSLDFYSKTNNLSFKEDSKLNALIYKVKDFILLKPTTYMNNSGIAIKKTIDYYKINIDDILIIVDDFNIPFSSLRLRYQGSSGGHNGLKSINAYLGTENYKRLRVGLGSVENSAINFVLSEFSKENLKSLNEDVFPKINQIIDEFIKGTSFDLIMNNYNESKK